MTTLCIATFLTSAVLAPSGGILAVDSRGIGLYDAGKWASMDSMFLEGPKVSQSTVDRLTAGTCYALSPNGSPAAARANLTFQPDERDPLWSVEGNESPFLWFGSKPPALRVNSVKLDSPEYLRVAREYLKTKGLPNAKPVLHSVSQVDLDGNGTNEVLIILGSRKPGDLGINFEDQFPSDSDYCAMIVREAKGKSVRTIEVDFYANKAKNGSGIVTLRGIWNLDGKPGAEVVTDWRSYESGATSISQFSQGKMKTVASAGAGV